MTITKRQKKRAEDAVVSALLKRGEVPTAERVEQELASRTGYGKPSLVFTPVKANELSDPKAFNVLVHSVKEDLDVAFGELTEHGEGISRSLNLYETERKMAELGLKKLERRIERLAERLDNPFSHNVLTENFHSFNQLSFKEDALSGIPKTTAHIDLDKGEARLEGVDAGTVKYDLSDAQVKVENLGENGKEISPFGNALMDALNGSWKYQVTNDSVQLSMVSVTITLPEAVPASRLSLKGRMPKETSVLAILSSDGKKQSELKEQVIKEQVEWQFDETVKEIKLILSKEEPDFTEGTEMHYLFSLLNVELKLEQYVKESFVVSEPLGIEPEILDKVILSVSDIVYPKTAIQYYIGTEGGGFMEWQEIRPDVPMQMNQLDRKLEILDETRAGYGDVAAENFGVTYYALGEFTEKPVSGRIQLYAGDYMWKVETQLLNGLEVTELPSLADWKDVRGVDITYLGVEETIQGKTGETVANSLQRFSIDVQAVREEEIYNIELVKGDARVQVYLNNEPLKPSAGGRYNYRLKAGWNRIEILTHSKEAVAFAPNLYFKDVASNVLASKTPLVEVTEYHLTHNVPKRDRSKFSLSAKGAVVNFDPSEVRFLTAYDYVPEGAEAIEDVRFMAKLTREEGAGHMTPVIKSYKIRLE